MKDATGGQKAFTHLVYVIQHPIVCITSLSLQHSSSACFYVIPLCANCLARQKWDVDNDTARADEMYFPEK